VGPRRHRNAHDLRRSRLHLFGVGGPEPGETFVGKEAVRVGFLKLLTHDRDSVSESGEVRFVGDWAVMTWGFRRAAGAGGQLVRGCDLFEFRDGLIVRKDSYRKTTPQALSSKKARRLLPSASRVQYVPVALVGGKARQVDVGVQPNLVLAPSRECSRKSESAELTKSPS
jgi:hypothetical protein